jgi:excisionase family DNA binding protein
MSENQPIPTFLTVKEVAARLGLSLTAVYALCEAGELPCHRVGLKGGRVRIPEDALAEYLERSKIEAPATVHVVTEASVAAPKKRRRRLQAVGFPNLRAAGWDGRSKYSS